MGKEQFEEMDEEMTVELELDDGTNVTCALTAANSMSWLLSTEKQTNKNE